MQDSKLDMSKGLGLDNDFILEFEVHVNHSATHVSKIEVSISKWMANIF